MTQELSADFSRRIFEIKVASGLAPTAFKHPSPTRGDSTNYHQPLAEASGMGGIGHIASGEGEGQ